MKLQVEDRFAVLPLCCPPHVTDINVDYTDLLARVSGLCRFLCTHVAPNQIGFNDKSGMLCNGFVVLDIQDPSDLIAPFFGS